MISQILRFQKNEITESVIYDHLSLQEKDPANREVLAQISQDEERHYQFWKKHSHQEVGVNWPMVMKYLWIARIFGLTFAVKLMENGEQSAKISYGEIEKIVPEVKTVIADEHAHEQKLIAMIDEERLRYTGSVVLGLSDALVELTGVLAGLTLALPQARVIATVGLITGIAAALSMAASEYFSTQSENHTNPVKAAIYTGIVYMVVVLVLVAPFLFLKNVFGALALTLAGAVFIIFLFTYYMAVVKDQPFKKYFTEMTVISLGVAALTFVIGYFVRKFLGVEI
ncbi:MAG: VIT1/CCC1 transporter family protein [Candidatus Omnitrophica bacterium]|nr:VIT1/CCC1 transporter family protein [Candidatus Omnitrophota bacterium]